MPEKVTAGRDTLGDFAPTFAALNDDVLFGQVWGREEQLSPRIRSIVTVTALMSSGVLDSSLQHHIGRAKANGVTADEMAEALTHAAFYAGWPKAWAAFRMATDIYGGGGPR
jgi:4-carboxymuconolactone decarboxylase